MNMFELQEKYIEELLNNIQGGWDRLTVDYERFPWKGEILERYKGQQFNSGEFVKQFSFTLEAIDILIELQETMKKEDSWTSCSVVVESDGKYDFQFGYGMPPMVEGRLRRTGEIQ